jgi:peptide subunit release factor 1 (eRF1)
MHHYAKEVAEVVAKLVESEGVERIALLGAQETIHEIDRALPEHLQELVVGERTADLHSDDEVLMESALEMAAEGERRAERSLWEEIRGEGLSHGLAAFGPSEVLAAAREGRVDTMIVTRDAEISGMRCRECELLAYAKPQQCPACKSTSVFEVDLVNELVELLALSGAEADFVDPIDGLGERGDVAALLRY